MDKLKHKLRNALNTIQELELNYTLIGGFAVSAWVMPRTTRDIDFAIAIEKDTDAEQIIRLFSNRGYKLLQLLIHQKTNLIVTARFCSLDSEYEEAEIDLLFNFSGIEKEIVASAKEINYLGKKTKVASIPALIAMKVLSASNNRLNDYADINYLLSECSEDELIEIENYLKLINKRNKNLEEDLLEKFKNIKQTII